MEDKITIIMPIYNSENYLKRSIESALSQTYKNIELLCVDDNLQRAIDAAGKEQDEKCAQLLEGVKLTQNGLMKTFNKFGISKMEIIGTIFDPNFHQVIQEVEDKEKINGTIVAELQTGYMINDRILREAMVIVTKGGKTE